MIYRLFVLPICIASAVAAAASVPTQYSDSVTAKPEMGVADTSSRSLFRFKEGLLSGDAKKEKLVTVLSSLSRTAKLKVVLRYAPEANEAVSFRIKNKALSDALKEALRGYNYVYIPAAESSGELSKLILLGKVFAQASMPAPEPIQEKEQLAESGGGVAAKRKKLAGPWGLDEFRSLKERCKQTAEANEHGTPTKEISEECRDREALEQEDKLARALDALETDYRDLKEAALDELKGINDPEATNALLDMALNSDDQELQQLAAEALWQHAADLGFKDADANQALEVLAKDGDSTVKSYGQQALEDAKRYAKHVKEENGG